jgi:hypothetical protein
VVRLPEGGEFSPLPDTEIEARQIQDILQAPNPAQPLQLRQAAARSRVLAFNQADQLRHFKRAGINRSAKVGYSSASIRSASAPQNCSRKAKRLPPSAIGFTEIMRLGTVAIFPLEIRDLICNLDFFTIPFPGLLGPARKQRTPRAADNLSRLTITEDLV